MMTSWITISVLLVTTAVLPSLVASYDLFITSAEGFSSYFIDPQTQERIGMRFQNAVYNERGGERIGTNQGYSMWYPNDAWMIAKYENETSTVGSIDALFKIPTRTLFLDDGSITCVNEAIVGATGSYTDYFGGTLLETATGTDPYEAEITLILPPQDANSAAVVHRTGTAKLILPLMLVVAYLGVMATF